MLIVTAWYSPFIHPRAHRWTAIAEHWASEGHEVHVLTAKVRECRQSEVRQGVRVHRVGFDSLKEWVYAGFNVESARGRVGVLPSKPGRFARLAGWFYQSIWKNLYFPDDACVWYFPARRKLKQLLENEAFDVLFTVSLPFTGHLLGLGQRVFWVADIGDPFSFQAKAPNNRFLYQHLNRHLERLVLKSAHAVVLTTEAARQKYRAQFGEDAVSRMSVIPPVCTFPLSTDQRSAQRRTSVTKLGYFGALYAPTRTPDAFLKLLSQTFSVSPAWRERLEVHFYGEVFPEFYEMLAAEPVIRLHGLCSRADAWAAMQEMDILVNIGNTTDFQLPSKAVDYLASGKPILNLSYTQNDPFAKFFEGNPMVFNLIVEEERVTEVELQHWLAWLEGEKPSLSEAEIKRLISPFSVKSIAERYLELMIIHTRRHDGTT